MKKAIFIFGFMFLFSFASAQDVALTSAPVTTTDPLATVSVPTATATPVEIISELPHYIRFLDFSENKVLLQDYSSGLTSKYFICDFSSTKILATDCSATTTDTFPKNNLNGQGFYKYRFANPDDNFGIAYKEDYIATTTNVTTYTPQVTYFADNSSTTTMVPTVSATTSTTTVYKIYLLDRSGEEVVSKDTGIVLDKYTGTWIMKNGLIVFIYHNDASITVYDLNTAQKLNEIKLLDSGLDKDDPTSMINYSTISNDGRYMAWYVPFSSSRDYLTYGLTELTTGKTVTRIEKVSFDRINNSTNLFEFSEDSKDLYFISGEKGYFTIWKANLEKTFTTNSWSANLYFTKKYVVTNFLIKNNHMYFVANREAPTKYALYDFDLKKENLKKISEYPVSSIGARFLYKDKIFYLYLDETKGINTAFYDLTTKKNVYLPLALDAKSTIDIKKYSTLKNVKDNTILGKPDKIVKENDTLLVFLHGGPYAQMFTGYNPSTTYGTFDWLLEGARKNGAYVAKIDFPGSAGYGVDYINKLVGGIGKVDVEAVNNSIAIIKKQNPNIKKVYTVGISYGGYLTVKTYVENPTAFDKVFSLAPVTDWASEYETGPYSFFNSHFGVFGTSSSVVVASSTATTSTSSLSTTTQALYDQASIIKHISTLPTSTVLTIYHGTKDYTVPVGETKAFDELMKANNKEYTLKWYEDQGHVFNKRPIWTEVCSDILSKIGLGNTTFCNLSE